MIILWLHLSLSEELPDCFPMQLYNFTLPPTVYKCSDFSTSLSTLATSLYFSHPSGCKSDISLWFQFAFPWWLMTSRQKKEIPSSQPHLPGTWPQQQATGNRMTNAKVLLLAWRKCLGKWLQQSGVGSTLQRHKREGREQSWCKFHQLSSFSLSFCRFYRYTFLHLLFPLRTISRGFKCFIIIIIFIFISLFFK